MIDPPMESKSRARQLAAYSYLVVFANDDTIDEEEFALLRKLALEDGEVDDDEKEVLKNLFNRVPPEHVKDKVWQEITEFRKEHDID